VHICKVIRLHLALTLSNFRTTCSLRFEMRHSQLNAPAPCKQNCTYETIVLGVKEVFIKNCKPCLCHEYSKVISQDSVVLF
jgi:hypothetical protein